METRDIVDKAEGLIVEASRARVDGRGDDCIRLLAEATALAVEHDLPNLVVKTSWRGAKAGFDFEDLEAMLKALEPLAEHPDPFQNDTITIDALNAIATKWWDQRGYADSVLDRMFQSLIRIQRLDQNPWMATVAQVRLAYCYACRGDQRLLDDAIESMLKLDPRSFGDGPHRHPLAPDTESSVWFGHMEMARVGLWAAVWADRGARARDLCDAMLDAAEAAQFDLREDVWMLDPVCRAAIAFDWPQVAEDYVDDWISRLESTEGTRADFHGALAKGLVETSDPAAARKSLELAVGVADASAIGAEWRVDARRALAKAVEDSETELSQQIMEESKDIGKAFGIRWAKRI